MPKVAVDEHDQLGFFEDNVGFPGETDDVSCEGKAVLFQSRVHFQLQCCVSYTDTGHGITALLRRKVVRHRNFTNLAQLSILR